MAWINSLAALATIAFGLIGWLAPRYTMDTLNLSTTDGSTLGLSEIRAASGALFVGLGLAGLLLKLPAVFLTIGCAYAGAAVGRITAIVLDGAGTSTSWTFFAVEVAFAAWLIGANLRGVLQA